MIAPVVLAAGVGDWLEALLPALIGLFWVVSQVLNALKAAGRARQPPPVAGPPRPRPPRGRPQADEFRTELERQIGEFLERPRPPAAGPSPRRPRPATRAAGRQAGRVPPPLPASGAAKPAAARRTDIARHVEDAFGHELEHLASSLAGGAPSGTEPQRPATVTPAVEIAAALRNPASLRQLVLLREVLERPVDRW